MAKLDGRLGRRAPQTCRPTSTRSSSAASTWWPAGEFTGRPWPARRRRSEEHTSELQSRLHLVCRLLLEKKKDLPQCDLKVIMIAVGDYHEDLLLTSRHMFRA